MKILRIITGLCICAALFFRPSYVSASSPYDLEDQPKSLTVYFYIQKNGVETPIEGACIGITKVADLTVDNGLVKYNTQPRYANIPIDYENMDVEESLEVAKTLAAQGEWQGKSEMTGKDGKCSFTNLSEGIYLVQELFSVDDASQYEFFDSYLIAVPLAENTSDGFKWKYDVLSEPKTKIREKDNSGSEPVSEIVSTPTSEPVSQSTDVNSQLSDDQQMFTGDSTRVLLLALSMFFASIMLITILHRGKEKDE